MDDAKDEANAAFVRARTINAANFIVGRDIKIDGGLSGQMPADPRALLDRIAGEIDRHRDSLVLADDLQADVANIAGELNAGDEPDPGRRQRLRARVERLAAGVGSVAELAGSVRELTSALGLSP